MLYTDLSVSGKVMPDNSVQVGNVPPKRHSEVKWFEVGLGVALLIIGAYIVAKNIVGFGHATTIQNQQLSTKVVNLAKAGNCQNGLGQLSKVKVNKYDDTTQSNILVYRLECYANTDPSKALAAGKTLEAIYKEQGNSANKNQQAYVEAVMQNVEQAQQAGGNAK